MHVCQSCPLWSSSFSIALECHPSKTQSGPTVPARRVSVPQVSIPRALCIGSLASPSADTFSHASFMTQWWFSTGPITALTTGSSDRGLQLASLSDHDIIHRQGERGSPLRPTLLENKDGGAALQRPGPLLCLPAPAWD